MVTRDNIVFILLTTVFVLMLSMIGLGIYLESKIDRIDELERNEWLQCKEVAMLEMRGN